MHIQSIIEKKEVVNFLISRNLLEQYKKCKQFLLAGAFRNVDFKLRKPKKKGIYYFRINKQYRAFCGFNKNELRVFKIDDHS